MSRTTRIAITGGDGILATALRAYFPEADYLSRASCDVANWNSVRQWFGKHPYDLVLHLAAETDNRAPVERYWHTNMMGTVAVTQAAKQQNARLLYASTDYVYPGTGQHREGDALQPTGAYGWSKLGGECAVHLYDRAVIVRGSWYADLSLLRASTDGYTSKVPVEKAAFQIATIATSTLTGVVNVGGPRRSLYEIVVSEFNPRCVPIQRADAAAPYPIPEDVSLDCTRFEQLVGRRA